MSSPPKIPMTDETPDDSVLPHAEERWLDIINGTEIHLAGVYFHHEIYDENTRSETHGLYAQAGYTNVSKHPKLTGWCGSHNGVSLTVRGLVKVIRVADSGRVLVRVLEGDALARGLNDLGYPDLIP